MEIKQITSEKALQDAERNLLEQVSRAGESLREQAAQSIAALRDAAAGIEALNAGMGKLLDRASALYVATFDTTNAYTDDGDVLIGGAELRFPYNQYAVALDVQHPDLRRGPRLQGGRRYRAIVVIEPID